MKNLQLHNLKCFIVGHPKATVSDYGKDIKAGQRSMKALNKYITSVTGVAK